MNDWRFPDASLQDVERILRLPAGFKADAILIVHEPLRSDFSHVQGFTVFRCDCHNHRAGLVKPITDTLTESPKDET